MSKSVSFRAKDLAGPPEHSAWVWHTSELLRSPAWHGASPTLRRVLDFLEIEHLRHERRENGNLMALYGDLVRFGVSRGLILKTLQEGEARGLLRVEHGFRIPANGKQAPNRFRLTYLPTVAIDPKTKATTWCRATDEWRRYVEPARARRNILDCTKVVLGSVPRTGLGDETESRVSAKNRVPPTVPMVGTLYGTPSTDLGPSPPASTPPAPAPSHEVESGPAVVELGPSEPAASVEPATVHEGEPVATPAASREPGNGHARACQWPDYLGRPYCGWPALEGGDLCEAHQAAREAGDGRLLPTEQRQSNGSDDQASGDPVKAIFDRGLAILGPTHRSLLGKFRMSHGDEAVLDAICACEAERPSEPVAFFVGCLKRAALAKDGHAVQGAASARDPPRFVPSSRRL